MDEWMDVPMAKGQQHKTVFKKEEKHLSIPMHPVQTMNRVYIYDTIFIYSYL